MKRTILSVTTAIALALPAAAQTEAEETVINVLVENGYPASSIEMLSQGQIAELYVVSTSESGSDVNQVIASFDLPSDEASDVLRDSPDATDVELAVMEILNEQGYAPSTIYALSAEDIANIYTTATSGDATGLNNAIESAIDVNTTMASDDPSMAEERATDYLMREGYASSEIETLEQAELVAIYVALTSSDESELQRVVEGALES